MALPRSIYDREYQAFKECNGETTKNVTVCQETGTTIKVEFSESGESINTYAEISALAGLATADVVLYTVPVSKVFKFKRVDFSGENRAVFEIQINSVTQAKYRTYFTEYNGSLKFDDILLSAGDVVKLVVENKTNSTADFNGNLQGKLDNA